ncbi:MAG: O-antigen polymerase [Bacteroidota bacterium]|nr:O-antigen polymerase [Bacteroidota bacterium]
MSFGTFGVHLLVSSAPTIMILSSEYFIIFRSQRRYGLIFFIILVITFFSYAFLLQRFFFLMWISISLVIAYYFTKYVNIKSVLISVALLVGLIIYLQSIRLSHYVQNYIYLISEMRYSINYAIFTEPYMYIVMNLENFARGIEKLTQFSIGYYTLDPLLALLGLKHPLSEYFNLIERPFLTSGYNTFPFLWVYYRDFGFFGMIICCFILGAMISFFYYRFLSNPTVTKCLIYAILVFFMVISFFTNIFSMLNVILNMTLLIFVHKYALKRKPLNISV